MRKAEYISLLCLLLFVILAGCKVQQPIVQHSETHDIVYIERYDTIVRLAPDSAAMKLLLECDSAGNVLLLALEQALGKNLSLQAQLKKIAQGTMVSVECKQDSLEQVIRGLRERIRELSNSDTVKEVEVEVIPPFYKWCAGIVCGTVAALVLWLIIWIARRCRRI